MNREVFLSLLALDSYNRGYGQNVLLNASDSRTNQNEAGRWIGDAQVLNVDLPDGSIEAGFYAIAYEWQGETIISYRGTDNISLESQSDVWTGWSLGGGFPAGSQAIAANDNRQHIRQAA